MLEQKQDWEPAYRNYHAVASKAIQASNLEKNPAAKQELKKLADSAIMQAQWCKQMIEDAKQSLRK